MKLSPDSGFMRGLGRAADLMLLNLLFLGTCLPLFTVGPALTALYSVTSVLGTAREKNVFRGYFSAFRESFGPSVRLWLLFLAVGAALAADILLCSHPGGLTVWLTVPFGILLAVLVLTAALAFPLLALFRNTVMGTVKSAMLLSLGNLPRAAAVAALWLVPVFLLLWNPVLFFYAGFAWVVIYFSCAAYLSGLLLRRVLAPWLPEDMFAEDPVSPSDSSHA